MTDSSKIAAPSSVNSPCANKRTWLACAGLHEAHAPLARLDGKIVFGDDYPEPIHFDAGRKLLCYRGFMAHASYVKLAALSDDREYQTALERLFVATSPTIETPHWQVPWKGVAAAAAVVLALTAGWYAWSARTPKQPPAAPAENRVVTLKVDATGDVAANARERAASQAEGEPRRGVER